MKMWSIRTLLSHHVWTGIGAIATLLALIVALFGKDALNIKRYVLIAASVTRSPIGVFSTFIFLVSLIGLFLFRREASKVKVGLFVFLLLSCGGFTVSMLNQKYNQKDQRQIVELRKEMQIQEKELARVRDIIQQRDNQIVEIKKVNQTLGKKVETQKKEIDIFKEKVRLKGNEIKEIRKDMSKEITDLKTQLAFESSKSKKLSNELATAEENVKTLKAGISNLRKMSKTKAITFEYSDNKLFLIYDDMKNEIFADYTIHGFNRSKSKKKIAIVVVKKKGGFGTYSIIVFNADSELSDLSIWEIYNHAARTPRNLKWVSDTVLRIYLTKPITGGDFKLHSIDLLEGTGTYQIYVDDFNTIVNVKSLEGAGGGSGG